MPQKPFDTDLQQTVYLSNYARWNPLLGRRETWPETCDRVYNFFALELAKRQLGGSVDLEELREAMFNLEVMPSMRIVQMGGEPLVREPFGAFNCSALPLLDWACFSELLYILMQGTGAGFSVEAKYVEQFPLIQKQTGLDRGVWVVPDTTEGWCDALKIGLVTWAEGGDVTFDFSLVRPYGSPLKTKGGKSAGPLPLQQLLEFARKLLLSHQGRKLSSLNLHDLACYCGSIVQVGGVRRSAEISLSDLHDSKMAHAKTGQFWLTAPERAMANNSAVFDHKPELVEFIGFWKTLIESGSGERGIFNRAGYNTQKPSRRARNDNWLLNPCAEVILRPFETCNLSIAVARPYDTVIDLERKVVLATRFGMIQSLLTNFGYVRPEWQFNAEDERLLGVDVTGQMDNPLFSSLPYRGRLYDDLKRRVVAEAKRLSIAFKINMPAATTVAKPSGNSSVLLNTSSGIHPRFAPFYIRRIRLAVSNPVAKLLTDAGVPNHPEVGQQEDTATIRVFEFPVASPTGAITKDAWNAHQQLEQWKACKVNYTEMNPSCTIYVKDDEWLEAGAWVYKNWDIVGGLSFLPNSGGVYELPPYEEVTPQQYNELMAKWPVIDFTQLPKYEQQDMTEVNRDYACQSGSCDL